MHDEALTREAIRIYRRYQTEIVEAFTFCPWAERARTDRRTREWVLSSPEPNVEASLAAIEAMDREPTVEVAFLIYPRVTLGHGAFERFVAEVNRADARVHGTRQSPFAMAAFHPDAALDMTDPERLIPFVRRSPDPTIQLIRLESLERVREGFFEGTQFVDMRLLMASGLTAEDTLSLRERIARANKRTIARLGVDALEQRFASIREDRAAAYASLGLSTVSCPSS